MFAETKVHVHLTKSIHLSLFYVYWNSDLVFICYLLITEHSYILNSYLIFFLSIVCHMPYKQSLNVYAFVSGFFLSFWIQKRCLDWSNKPWINMLLCSCFSVKEVCDVVSDQGTTRRHSYTFISFVCSILFAISAWNLNLYQKTIHIICMWLLMKCVCCTKP